MWDQLFCYQPTVNLLYRNLHNNDADNLQIKVVKLWKKLLYVLTFKIKEKLFDQYLFIHLLSPRPLAVHNTWQLCTPVQLPVMKSLHCSYVPKPLIYILSARRVEVGNTCKTSYPFCIGGTPKKRQNDNKIEPHSPWDVILDTFPLIQISLSFSQKGPKYGEIGLRKAYIFVCISLTYTKIV